MQSVSFAELFQKYLDSSLSNFESVPTLLQYSSTKPLPFQVEFSAMKLHHLASSRAIDFFVPVFSTNIFERNSEHRKFISSIFFRKSKSIVFEQTTSEEDAFGYDVCIPKQGKMMWKKRPRRGINHNVKHLYQQNKL